MQENKNVVASELFDVRCRQGATRLFQRNYSVIRRCHTLKLFLRLRPMFSCEVDREGQPKQPGWAILHRFPLPTGLRQVRGGKRGRTRGIQGRFGAPQGLFRPSDLRARREVRKQTRGRAYTADACTAPGACSRQGARHLVSRAVSQREGPSGRSARGKGSCVCCVGTIPFVVVHRLFCLLCRVAVQGRGGWT